MRSSMRGLLILLICGGCSLSELDKFYLAPDGGNCIPDPNPCQGKCGQFTNCQMLIMCGDCPQGLICGGGGPNICGTSMCTPDCTGKACGDSDGCRGVCSDGMCP